MFVRKAAGCQVAYAYHPVQTGSIEQVCPHIDGPIPVIRGGKTGAHIDYHLAVLSCGNADRLRENGLYPYFSVAHKCIAYNGTLLDGFFNESGQDLHAVQAAVAVREDAAHFLSYGTYQHPGS